MKLSLSSLLSPLAVFVSVGVVACSTTTETGDSQDAVISESVKVLRDHDEDVLVDHLLVRGDIIMWSTTGRDAPASTIWKGRKDRSESSRIADIEGRVFQMAIYGSQLYVVPDESGGILTLPASEGASPRKLYEDQATAEGAAGVITTLAATIDGVFAGRDDGTILEVMRDGSLRTAKTGATLPRNLGVWEDTANGGAFAYYVDDAADDSPSGGDTQIVYAALRKNRDGAFELPESGWKTVPNLARAHMVTGDRDHFYVATWGTSEEGDAGEILIAPSDGGQSLGAKEPASPPRVIASGLMRPTNILVDDQGIYFSTGPGTDENGRPHGGALMAIARSDLAEGKAPVVRCFAQDTAPAALAQTKTDLIWIAQTEKQIVSWSKASVWANAKPCAAPPEP